MGKGMDVSDLQYETAPRGWRFFLAISVTARFWTSLSWLYSAMKGYAVAHVAIASVARIDDRMVK